ncbi:RagB/SusD family nutrient uptake outer membrane protein [Bacteroides difficilis]|uniref:RagB/SusD family nutrient uptake outer membrane protein n=1 Tax=Bacteroides difficilis TaxID=2763021 RepID=UPI003AB0FB6A
MKKYLFFILVSSILVGCTDWLKEEPVDRFVEDNFFVNKKSLRTALLGGYGRFADLYVDKWAAWLGEWGTDAVCTQNVADSYGYHRYLFASTAPIINTWYNVHYEVISRFNTVLKRVDEIPDMTTAEKEEVKGECLFMRALCYFRLVQTLGPVPLILDEFNEMDNSLPRASVGEVYTAIINDLKIASEEGRLPDMRVADFTRTNRTAARALLGKVYLTLAGHMENGKVDAVLATIGRETLGYQSYTEYTSEQLYQLTEEALFPLIGSVDISSGSYEDIFLSLTFNKNTNSELIWQIQFNSDKAGSAWAKHAGVICRPSANYDKLSGSGRYNVLYVPDMYYSYSAGDVRRDWSCNYSWYNGTTNKWTFFDPRLGYEQQGYTSWCNIQKFREKETVFEQSEFADPNQRPTNYPFLRYSDVVLMCAEAELMQDGIISETTFAEIRKIESRARGGMSSSERLAYLKVRKNELYEEYVKKNAEFVKANEYYLSVKDNPNIPQSIKDLALAENDRLSAERGNAKGESDHAANELKLWETGIAPAASIPGYQQGLEPQPFLEYTREAFNLEALKRERLLELAFEGHRRYDLLRWGELVEKYDGVRTIKEQINGMGRISDYNVLLPLPLTQVDLSTNKEGFFQNPGY